MSANDTSLPKGEVKDSLGGRLLRIRLAISARSGERLSQEEFGGMLAVHMGREKAFTGATVSRWESGEATPDIHTLRVIASLVGFDPGWLAFGSATEARGPDERRHAEMQARREAFEREQEAWSTKRKELIEHAAERTREWHKRLHKELEELLDVDTPEGRRRRKEIVREMDGPSPMDYLSRDLFMTEEEAERERKRDRKREQRYEEEDLEESEDDG